MARKTQLRSQRTGTVINTTAKSQETDLIVALSNVAKYLDEKFQSIKFVHDKSWYLRDIVRELQYSHSGGGVNFHYHSDTSFIRPDGGFLYIRGKQGDNLVFPILISEVKNQGTNDLRAKEGLGRQARGNAIERLGKNLIGLRTALMRESIFPFVCFGYGCDFEEGSSVLDRVSTMAMFGELNKTHLHNLEDGKFNRGSFYFRERQWTVAEMTTIMKDIAERSILYYFSEYGKKHFQQ